MNKEQFIEFLKELGITLDSKQLKQYDKYYEMLREWNNKINLTAITEEEDVFLKHFYDSLLLSKSADFNKKINLCDVGAGAGFPSIPMKIAFPNIKVTIVDSLGKRITFLKELINELELDDVEAVHARAEEYTEEYREQFDIVTARAVARLNILSELCIPLVRVGGKFIAMKAQSGEDELLEAKTAIKKLGCTVNSVNKMELPFDSGLRTVLVFDKKISTPNKFPRNFGQIKKKPL